MVQRNVERIRSMVLDILYYAKDRELEVADVDVGALVRRDRGVAPEAGDRPRHRALARRRRPTPGSFPATRKAIRAMLVNLVENSLDACRADGQQGRAPGRASRCARAPPLDGVRGRGQRHRHGPRDPRQDLLAVLLVQGDHAAPASGCSSPTRSPTSTAATIEVDSEPGRGTPLRRPPAARGEAERASRADAAADASAPRTDGGGDGCTDASSSSTTTRTSWSTCASFLEDHGYETRAAADGADALAAVAAFRPDAVLTDVLLPGRSGLDLLVTLRHDRRTADIPVVIMTGMDQILHDDAHSYLTNHVDIRGPDAVIGKPIDPRALLEVLDRVCAASAAPAT